MSKNVLTPEKTTLDPTTDSAAKSHQSERGIFSTVTSVLGHIFGFSKSAACAFGRSFK